MVFDTQKASKSTIKAKQRAKEGLPEDDLASAGRSGGRKTNLRHFAGPSD